MINCKLEQRKLHCIPKAESTERRAVHELGHGGDGIFETGWSGDLEGRETGGEFEGEGKGIRG